LPKGVKGDKGEQGDAGQGIQGDKGDKGDQGDAGTAGANALWNFRGAYSGGDAYAVGDIATYDGQLWYRFNSNGGNVGDTPSEGLWNLLAQKGDKGDAGADGQDLTEGAYLPLAGGTLFGNVSISKTAGDQTIDSIVFNGEGASQTTSGRIELRGFIPDGNENANYSSARLDSYGVSGFPYATSTNDTGMWSLSQAEVRGSDLVEGLSWSLGFDGLTFPDTSVQTTAFPPAGGTTSDYIRGDGSLYTFPSIPSLTGYATETFVTSQGYLTSSDLTSYATQSYVTSQGYITSSALTPYLTSATASSTYQTLSGMSSYLTTANASSTYTTKANNLSDVTASTARTNLGLTSLATASYATTIEAQAGTSTTTVISPSVLDFWENWSNTYDFSTVQGGQSNTSGTSPTLTVTQTNKNLSAPPSTVGYAQYSWSIMQAVNGVLWNNGFNWNKKYCADFNISTGGSTDTTNSAGWVVIGETGSVNNFGSPNGHSVGVKIVGLNFYGFCHNGTTLNLSASPIKVATANISYTIRVITDGAGNASFYVDDVFVTTMNNCPTGQAGYYRNAVAIKCVNTATLSGTPVTILINKLKLRIK
jgi:hypothetical protein